MIRKVLKSSLQIRNINIIIKKNWALKSTLVNSQPCELLFNNEVLKRKNIISVNKIIDTSHFFKLNYNWNGQYSEPFVKNNPKISLNFAFATKQIDLLSLFNQIIFFFNQKTINSNIKLKEIAYGFEDPYEPRTFIDLCFYVYKFTLFTMVKMLLIPSIILCISEMSIDEFFLFILKTFRGSLADLLELLKNYLKKISIASFISSINDFGSFFINIVKKGLEKILNKLKKPKVQENLQIIVIGLLCGFFILPISLIASVILFHFIVDCVLVILQVSGYVCGRITGNYYLYDEITAIGPIITEFIFFVGDGIFIAKDYILDYLFMGYKALIFYIEAIKKSFNLFQVAIFLLIKKISNFFLTN